MSITVHLTQTHDANGQPSPETFVQPVTQVKELQTWPDAVLAFIRPLNPSRTGRIGTYTYRDPERGSGTLTIHGANTLHLDRIDELVHMEDICRTIGMKDPTPQEDIPLFLTPLVLKIRNPYVQLVYGAVFGMGPACLALLTPVLAPGLSMFSKIGIPILGLVLCVLAVLMMRRGIRRLSWWTVARAQAKRDGGPIPEELQAWI